MTNQHKERSVLWVGSSRKDLKQFDEDVKDEIGHSLWKIQNGKFPHNVKQLKGFGSDGIYEISARLNKDTYRTVIALKIDNEIYVLHCFKKKSKRGISTPQSDINLIKQRIKAAKQRIKNERVKENKDRGQRRSGN